MTVASPGGVSRVLHVPARPAHALFESRDGRVRRHVIEDESMVTSATTVSLPASKSRAAEIAQALVALALGLFVVGVVGFSHLDVMHNAAHDVRHSNAFPCH